MNFFVLNKLLTSTVIPFLFAILAESKGPIQPDPIWEFGDENDHLVINHLPPSWNDPLEVLGPTCWVSFFPLGDSRQILIGMPRGPQMSIPPQKKTRLCLDKNCGNVHILPAFAFKWYLQYSCHFKLLHVKLFHHPSIQQNVVFPGWCFSFPEKNLARRPQQDPSLIAFESKKRDPNFCEFSKTCIFLVSSTRFFYSPALFLTGQDSLKKSNFMHGKKEGKDLRHSPAMICYLIIAWVVPLPSNSHHQNYYMFSRESL